MPISGIGSYLPTMQEFIYHWTQVNLALGGAPATDLKLKGGYTLANFTTDRAAIQSVITAVDDADNLRQIASDDREIKKAALRPRITQFRGGVKNLLQATAYEGALPTLPDYSQMETRFLRPFDDMASLWAKINMDLGVPGFTPPMTLAGGYALATFNTDLATLRTSYLSVTNNVKGANLARERRNVLLPPAVVRMKQYRNAVLSKFAATDPLVQSLPALSPPPGATPDPVSVSGEWSAALLKAVLTWTASDNPHLAHYSIRTAPGPTYRAQDETTIGEAAAGILTFATEAGLAAPGAQALFKVYVVLTTGNEKGSATVKVIRPE